MDGAMSRSVGRRVRPRREVAAMEERRMRVAAMFEQEVRPAEVARQVGVSHQIVSDRSRYSVLGTGLTMGLLWGGYHFSVIY